MTNNTGQEHLKYQRTVRHRRHSFSRIHVDRMDRAEKEDNDDTYDNRFHRDPSCRNGTSIFCR